MPEIILHQYASSPFSEKVRCLLGYKELEYKSVDIPVIMPKPDLMALTGGYRKTPVLQYGADIYCDTAIICRFIEEICPSNPVYSASQEAALSAAARSRACVVCYALPADNFPDACVQEISAKRGDLK